MKDLLGNAIATLVTNKEGQIRVRIEYVSCPLQVFRGPEVNTLREDEDGLIGIGADDMFSKTLVVVPEITKVAASLQ